MSEQKEKEKLSPQSQVNCPRCNSPMILKSIPGFGGMEKLTCTKLSCPSHQPVRGWSS